MKIDYMEIAKEVAKASKDPNTKVGSVIISEDGRILSCGYNGAPRRFNDDKVPKSRTGNFLETKYPYICHSELNAILNYRGSLGDFSNATLYCTLFPCNECAKAIAQVGISKIIYAEDKHHDDDIYKASRIILDECKIEYKKGD